MEYLPLSPGEEEILPTLIESLREAAAELAEAQDEPVMKKYWWDSEEIVVTEVACGHGGIGRDETLATFASSHTGFLLARMSAIPGGQASSLLLVDSHRGPLAVRFRRYRKKGRTLRFLVGEPGRRGSVWRLWTGTSEDDVYFADRHSSAWSKFSLHASGDWRLQWTTEDRTEVAFWSEDDVRPEGRIMAQWREPPTGPVGWTHAMSVFTMADDVKSIPDDNQTGKNPVQVPAPPAGWMVELAVYLVAPDAGIWDMSRLLDGEGAFARLVGGYLLPGGRTVVVWAFTRPIPPGMADELSSVRTKAFGRQLDAGWDLHPSSGPRTLLARGPDDEGVVRLWDLALA